MFRAVKMSGRIFNRLRLLKIQQTKKRQFSNKFTYGEEVITAKKNNTPIVALESTIITHGMPFPDNFNTAIRVENIVRQGGAVPATIGILEGKIHVGLNENEIKKLAEEAGGPKSAIKCSQRDICSIVASGLNGGTTVGATVVIANLAGISVMATGGIGGVHRGADQTFDISSDLVVLGKTPVSVICAGVKAILDIPKTLEFLETLGVPVVTISSEETFPAFYSRRTSDYIKSPARVLESIQAAKCIQAQRDLKIHSGLIFAVPLPESAALDPTVIEKFIEIALKESEEKAIRGKYVTPYLLKRVTELSGGKSLAANKVLIENNAAVAADIAVQLSKLSNGNSESFSQSKVEGSLGQPVVIGGVTEDTVLQCVEPIMRFDGRTHKGKSRRSIGGVGRNVTAALVALGINETRFLSAVGDDDAGKIILKSLGSAGKIVAKLPNEITARYTGLIDNNGECKFGFGEMDIFDSIDVSLVMKNRSLLENARLIILDGNPPLETIREVIGIAVNCLVPVWYEPTDVKKACKIFESHPEWGKVLQFISPNIKELFTMADYFSIPHDFDATGNVEFETIQEVARKLGEHVPVVMTTMGAEGLLMVRKSLKEDPFYRIDGSNKLALIETEEIRSRVYQPLSIIDEKSNKKYSASGCGDCLAAGIITGILRGLTEDSCVNLGLRAASLSLESLETVPETLLKLR